MEAFLETPILGAGQLITSRNIEAAVAFATLGKAIMIATSDLSTTHQNELLNQTGSCRSLGNGELVSQLRAPGPDCQISECGGSHC